MSQPSKPIRLSALEAEFLLLKDDGSREHVDFAQAQGVMFLCPLCFERNGGNVGTHAVAVWFRGRDVPDSETPGPGRWEASGTSIEDLTLSPSVHLTSQHGCGWHGWVKNGAAQ